MDSINAVLKYILILISFISFSSYGQYRKSRQKISKNSMAKGTLYAYWGYNRSAYSSSNVYFKAPGANFTLYGVQAKDRPSLNFSEYINPSTFTVPQFNFRIGYNFKNYWNISLGYDHMKYVMIHGPNYVLSGFTESGFNQSDNLYGNYTNHDITSEENTFHYENSNGLNYIRLELTRIRNIIRNKKDNFTFSLLGGLSAGGIVSFNDFTFNGEKFTATPSLSGFGASMHGGMRFEFFKHVFLQLNSGGGFLYQSHVKLIPYSFDAFAKQHFFYGDLSAVLGVLLYIRPVNNCNTCPHWY